MKKLLTRTAFFAVLLTVLLVFLPTNTQAAQPALEDYVDMAEFSAYMRQAFDDLVENQQAVTQSIDLRPFHIPADLHDQATRACLFAVPELSLVGHYYVYYDTTELTTLDISLTALQKDPIYFDEIRRAGNALTYGIEDNDGLDQVERALLLHDRLALWTAYDYDNYVNDTVPAEAYTAYGALINRIAVCSGYTDAYSYLLARAGIYSEACSSTLLDHEWNIVYIDGVPYHTDVTWDDPVQDTLGRVMHDNFLRSTEGFIQTGHITNGTTDYNTTPSDTTYDKAYWQTGKGSFQVIEDRLYYMDKNNGYVYEVVDGQKTMIFSSDRFGQLGCIQDRLLHTIGQYIYYWDFELQEDRFVIDMQAEVPQRHEAVGWVYEKSQIVVHYSYMNESTGSYERYIKSYYYELPPDTGWQNDPYGDFFYDENRQRVKNTWLKDDIDYRYLGSDGYVVYNEWCEDSMGRFYADRNGYLGRNQWVSGELDVHWLGQDGLPVHSQWITYKGELYYIGENSYVSRNKWIEDSGGLRYLDSNGVSVHSGWQSIGSYMYYFTPEGYRYFGRLDFGSCWAWFDEEGRMIRDRWFQDDTGKRAYANNQGYVYPERWYAYDGMKYNHCNEPYYDLTETNMTYYYLDEGGYRFTGWKQFGDKWRYFDESGRLIYNTWYILPDGKYYLSEDGHRVVDCWVYETESTTQFYSHSTADFYGGKLRYLDHDGRLSIGWKELYDGWYWFDENGVKANNRWVKDSVGWCYVGNGGLMVKNTWIADSKGMCFLDSNGRMKTNAWVLHNGYWYYVNSSGYRVSDWQRIGSKWYYFQSSGIMAENCWVKKDGNSYSPYSGFSRLSLSKYPHYRIDASGAMATGWRKIEGNWFYFDSSGLMVKEKWAKDSVGWCYLDQYGIMLTSCWKKDSKGWCYIGDGGYILTNKWLQKNGDWYYLDSAGYRASGWKQLGGKWYYFYSDGVMASNTYMDGGWINADGVWKAS